MNRGSSELRKGRVSEKGALYFITKTLIPGSVFPEEQRADIIESFYYFRSCSEIKLHAFVVMPDHWHGLISVMTDKTLPRLIREINARASYPARAIGGRINWQDGFHDHKVRADEKVKDIVKYIEANPVRKALAATPGDWKWSSANKNYEGLMDRSWLGHERW